MKILSRPSFSASAFTRPEPGTTIAETFDATLRPRAISAAAIAGHFVDVREWR
jgi:hypothetical protein